MAGDDVTVSVTVKNPFEVPIQLTQVKDELPAALRPTLRGESFPIHLEPDSETVLTYDVNMAGRWFQKAGTYDGHFEVEYLVEKRPHRSVVPVSVLIGPQGVTVFVAGAVGALVGFTIQQVLVGDLIARLDAWFDTPNRPVDDIAWGLIVAAVTMLLGGFLAYYFRRKGSTESYFTIEDSGGAFIAGAVAAFTGVTVLISLITPPGVG